MSYDLFFKSRNSASTPTANAFTEYFKERKNYEVSNQQAIYQNETTGVYFIFDIGELEDMEDPDLLPLSFNLNYMRPHIFGLEGEMEVRALVQRFGLLVSDPQIEGMDEGEYSTEAFLRGWNKGNEAGYRCLFEEDIERSPLTLPTARIEACWRWNLGVDDLQATFGEEVFVPRFMFLHQGGATLPTVVWPDCIPIAMPQADLVVIERKDILPKKFFRSREDLVVASWNEVAAILEQFPLEQGALPYRLLRYSEVPESVLAHVRSLAPTTEKLQGVGADKVLNAELVAKGRGK